MKTVTEWDGEVCVGVGAGRALTTTATPAETAQRTRTFMMVGCKMRDYEEGSLCEGLVSSVRRGERCKDYVYREKERRETGEDSKTSYSFGG